MRISLGSERRGGSGDEPGSFVRAEWVEIREVFLERQRTGEEGNKGIFYLHGVGFEGGGSFLYAHEQ